MTIICKFHPAPRYKLPRNVKPPEYRQGRKDRLNGKPCASANGQYLNGWYSVPNPKR